MEARREKGEGGEAEERRENGESEERRRRERKERERIGGAEEREMLLTDLRLGVGIRLGVIVAMLSSRTQC